MCIRDSRYRHRLMMALATSSDTKVEKESETVEKKEECEEGGGET